ncbi:MAG: hypothetical protein AAGK04_12610, partial [Planctomycetota bacterium]
MTDHTYLEDGAPDRDVLLSRLIDAEASAEDWAAFKRLASEDQNIWAELGEAQRAHDDLAIAVRRETSVADEIEAPIEARLSDGLTARLRALWSYGGWAAAAVVLLTFTLGRPGGPLGAQSSSMQAAGIVPALVTPNSAPDEALQAYLDLGEKAGTVLGEAPQFVVLESTPAADGDGYEVVYLRQLVERRRVETLYQNASDE